MKTYRYPSVLSIAGFDGSGGAGIQADIKTISALGCYATTVLTALPVQSTTGVKSIYPISDQAVSDQLISILDDIFPEAIKIGMVHNNDLVSTIVRVLALYPLVPVVFDPVMVSTSGHYLIEKQTIQQIVQELFPLATVVTPNMDEAAILVGMDVNTIEDMYTAGHKILELGCKSVLLKGGHLKGERITSLYFDVDGSICSLESDKYHTRNTHGSGCSLSSAIASYIALGFSPLEAVKSAQNYVQQAIFHGADVKTGNGNGPLNHFFNPKKMIKNELV